MTPRAASSSEEMVKVARSKLELSASMREARSSRKLKRLDLELRVSDEVLAQLGDDVSGRDAEGSRAAVENEA